MTFPYLGKVISLFRWNMFCTCVFIIAGSYAQIPYFFFYLKLQIVIITAINVSITKETNVAGNMPGHSDVDNNLGSLIHLIGQQTIQAITLGPNHA